MKELVNKINDKLHSLIKENEVSRVFHGRGGTIPEYDFINVDLYPPAIFITIFKDVDYSEFVNLLILEHGEVRPIIVQERFGKEVKSLSLGVALPEKHIVFEHGLKYLVNLEQNQNTGFFLDMKDERYKLIEDSKDKNILNLFSYTCSLSVASRQGGAKQVVNIDQKKTFLNIGRENHRLNSLDQNVIYKSWDILKSFNQIGKYGPFDTIICDPPSNQGKSFFYKKDYQKIIRRMSAFLAKDGVFVACLNTPFETTQFLKGLFENDEKNWELVEERFSSTEYKEIDKENGLKICIFKKIG
ncbi:class I SAM-dependent methyltransferase [Halobacteriovorax sp.]|uniref:class I SAM-dependent methyltransferase n=1 Tax=Halobacteriovorax sp. TaxID=2020862 RepID=UPI003568B789